MTCAGCQAYDAAERAAIEERPHTSDAPVACTCAAEPTHAWTWAPRREAPERGIRLTMTGDELRAALASPASHAGPKETLPLVAPATFHAGVVRVVERGVERSVERGVDYRHGELVERVSMLGLDLDKPATADPAARMTTIAEALGNVEVFACSTFSSEPGAYRLRAFVPYDKPATADEHRASWSLVRRVLDRAGIAIDSKCSDPSRGYYVWAVPPTGVYWHGYLPGAPWPASHSLEVEAARTAREREASQRGATQRVAERARGSARRGSLSVVERARRYVNTMAPAISGSDGSGATWRVARVLVADFELDDVDALDILRDYSARCSPPWSERELHHKVQSARSNARVRVDMNRGAA